MCSSAGVITVKEEEASNSVTEMQEPRSREPEHFLLKVESFSESKLEKYESDEFEAEGHKWRLMLYPNGDKERNGSSYISLYLSLSDTQSLPVGWEVEADFSLFVYNSISQKHHTYKLADKTLFNWLKMDSGFAQLMPLDEFKDTSNGYVFGDTCVFGAEVHVTGYKAIAKRQTLTMKDSNAGKDADADTDSNGNIFTWTVGNFSTFTKPQFSENFIIEDVTWIIWLYPKDKSISVYLAVDENELTKLAQNPTVEANVKLRIRNQLNTNHVEKQATHMFSNSSLDWGSDDFMPLSIVKDKSKGFLKKDSLVIEVEISKVEIIEHFT